MLLKILIKTVEETKVLPAIRNLVFVADILYHPPNSQNNRRDIFLLKGKNNTAQVFF